MFVVNKLFSEIKNLLFNLILVDQIIVSFFNFIIIVFLSRSLSIDDFGNYSGMFVVFLFLTSIQQAIFVAPIYTLEVDLSKNNSLKRINEVRSIVLISTIVLSFVFFSLSNIVLDLISVDINNLGFALMLFFYLNNDFNRRFLIKIGNLKKVIFYDFIIYPCFFLTILYLRLSNNLSLHNIIFSYCVISGLAIAAMILNMGISLKMVYLNIKVLKKYWDFSKWILYSSFSQFITGNLFTVVASSQLGASVYGIVRVFQGFSGVFNVGLQYLDTKSSVDLPKLFKNSGVNSCLKYCYNILLFFVIFLSIIYTLSFTFGFDLIIDIFFGEKYISYSYFLNFVFILVILNLINILIRQLFRVFNSTSKILVTNLFASFLTIISIESIISSFGIEGVYFGTILSHLAIIISGAWFIFFYNNNSKINGRQF